MTRGRVRAGGAKTGETPAPASARRRALTDAVDRLVGAAECLGAVPVDTGDVRALAVIVGAQARVVEALARLDSAEDRRRTGRVQRELLRARLATLPQRDDHGAVVVLPSLDAPADPVDRLTARLATLTRERTQRVDELRAMAPADRQALVRERVAALLARDDDDALERLATLTREV
jgi:hypothetical protein